MLKLGDKDIKDVMFGDKEVQKVFVGDRLVWERGLDWSKCIVGGWDKYKGVTLEIAEDFAKVVFDVEYIPNYRYGPYSRVDTTRLTHGATHGNTLLFPKLRRGDNDFNYKIYYNEQEVYEGYLNIRLFVYKPGGNYE